MLYAVPLQMFACVCEKSYQDPTSLAKHESWHLKYGDIYADMIRRARQQIDEESESDESSSISDVDKGSQSAHGRLTCSEGDRGSKAMSVDEEHHHQDADMADACDIDGGSDDDEEGEEDDSEGSQSSWDPLYRDYHYWPEGEEEEEGEEGGVDHHRQQQEEERRGPYGRINTLSPITLRQLQFLKLMADLNIGPTNVERIIAFFKAIGPSVINMLPKTYDALVKPFVGMEDLAQIHIEEIDVPAEALEVIKEPTTLLFG